MKPSSPRRVVLIGHRGTGKTSFLERIQKVLGPKTQVLDLDHYIETKVGKKIPTIFSEEGESRFRKLETECFKEITQRAETSSTDFYLAVGAGFIPQQKGPWVFWWLRRPTDTLGRLFLNRPRLNESQTPLEEFHSRALIREQLYSQWADETLCLQEGFDFSTSSEEQWINNSIQNLGGALTVDAFSLSSEERAQRFFERRKNWGIKWFELRDDLLEPQILERALRGSQAQGVSPHQLLLSFRRPEGRKSSRAFQLKHQLAFDWPWEWGPCPWGPPKILSYHHREATQAGLSTTLSRLPSSSSSNSLGSIVKLALPIHSFSELLEGHLWQQADPLRRSFLPMSDGGRWRWYRLLMKSRTPIQFLREGAGSAPDQPTLLEWLRLSELPGSAQELDRASSQLPSLCFAAILGAPVEHSRTPAAHFEFFKSRGSPVFAIQVSREDWEEGALDVIQKLGLRWAAITSPLKDLALKEVPNPSSFVRDLGAVNTLAWSESLSHWVGTNTDSAGLAQALACHLPNYKNLHFAIWGGGGTLEIAKQVLPQTTTSYSSRTGQARTPKTFLESPDVILWSVGRKNFDLSPRFPPSEWKARYILDMNYSEDSPGLEYALKTGIQYFNGLEMFKGQAASQQEFWKALDPHEQYDE